MEWSEALFISALSSFTEQMPSLIVDTVSSLSNHDGDSHQVRSEVQYQGWGKGQGIHPVEYFLNLSVDSHLNILPPFCP